ncbi:MAG: TonB-dependent receptor domain-containing protein [Myxococcota bacterium]
MARHSTRFVNIEWNLQIAYTLTLTEFLTTFVSNSPLFGSVEAGDSLPYIPTHQGSATLGAAYGDVDAAIVGSYVGKMRDLPGQGTIEPSAGTDDAWLVDATLGYQVSRQGRVYFRADNLLGEEYIASRRPFGARPGKPRTYFIGYKHDFFD